MTKVVEIIDLLIDDFRSEHGRKPSGVVLGPIDYLELCEYFARTNKAMKDASIFGNLITEFRGYPIHVKETNGIELLISPLDAHTYRRV